MGQLKNIFALLKPDLYIIIFGLVLCFCEIVTVISENSLSGFIVDSLQGDHEAFRYDDLNYYCKLLVFNYFIQTSMAFVDSYLFKTAGAKLSTRVKKTLFESIIDSDVAFFDENKTGELTSRLSGDVVNLTDIITNFIPLGAYHLMKLSGTVVYMVYLSYKLSLAILLCIPILGISYYFQGNSERKMHKEILERSSESNQTATEAIGNAQTVKSFIQESFEKRRYIGGLYKIESVARQIALQKSLVESSTYLSFNVCVVVGMWYGGSLVLDGDLTSGQLISYTLMALSLTEDLSALPGFVSVIAKATSSSERIFEIINRQSEQIDSSAEINELRGDIEFQDVRFRYPSRPDIEVLKGLSLNIKRGETVALVGTSGSGKTTIMKLIQKFYDITSGRILVDGIDISGLNTRWLRTKIGVVSQEPVLFSMTIRENINYGCPFPETLSEEDTMTAAKLANAHDFICSLSEGYDTFCGEGGNLLSVGQKQRIAIARAIMADPSILFLDEATSSLDNESESLVQEAIDHLIQDRSCIIIAHRLSTIRNADRIYVVKDGRVVESGTHSELRDLNGEYSHLVNTGHAFLN